jgi:hypothetical protein
VCGHEVYLRILQIKTPNPCQNRDGTLMVAVIGQIPKKNQRFEIMVEWAK